ncbi:MAG: hypothetical protein RIQ41_422 [Candidatus Parcubacteria bacterium]|jgi:hypothetical protein
MPVIEIFTTPWEILLREYKKGGYTQYYLSLIALFYAETSRIQSSCSNK